MVAGDGIRQTVNANLSSAQTTWNLRSALNVAALNCRDFEHNGIIENYGAFLKRHERQLSATNRALQDEFRQKHGGIFRDVQDTYMTKVYNYFALPPALDNFCDVSFAISQEALLADPKDLDSFAARTLPRIESVFEDFFRAYERYRVDLAAWDSQYGPPTTTTMVQSYTNPLDPSVTMQPSQAVVGSMRATQPVIVAGEAQVPIALPPATGQEPALSLPTTSATLPTQGPIFSSGEIVQGETPTVVIAPSAQAPVFQSGEVVQGEEAVPASVTEPTARTPIAEAVQTPVFQSGEVVQGEEAAPVPVTEPVIPVLVTEPVPDDQPVQTPIFQSGEIVQKTGEKAAADDPQ